MRRNVVIIREDSAPWINRDQHDTGLRALGTKRDLSAPSVLFCTWPPCSERISVTAPLAPLVVAVTVHLPRFLCVRARKPIWGALCGTPTPVCERHKATCMYMYYGVPAVLSTTRRVEPVPRKRCGVRVVSSGPRRMYVSVGCSARFASTTGTYSPSNLWGRPR